MTENLWALYSSYLLHLVQVLYNIGKVRSDTGDTTQGVAAYREAVR